MPACRQVAIAGGLVPQWIDHADESPEDQVSHDVALVVAVGQVTVCERQNAQRAAGQFLVDRLEPRAVSGCKGAFPLDREPARAPFEHNVGSSLDVRDSLALRDAVNRHMRLVSLLKGTSPTRGKSRFNVTCERPAFSAAMIRAPSVGSPRTTARPST